MYYFFDTDILGLLWRNHERVVERVRRVGNTVPLAITRITWIEVLQGRFASVIKAANALELLEAGQRLLDTMERLGAYPIAAIEKDAADLFDKLRANKKLKNKIGNPDLLIACIALANDAVLVTRNTKDFSLVPGLKIENWAD